MTTPAKDQCKSELKARIVSGTIGSIITSLVVTPLDVVKIRQQAAIPDVQVAPNLIRCPRGCGTFVVFNGHMDCVLSKQSVSYFDSMGGLTQQAKASATNGGGPLRLMRTIFATEGLRGIYAGLFPTLLMAVPNTVLYFSAYDEFIYWLRKRSNDASWAPLVAGGSARFLASSITAPLEALRTRQAAAGQSAITLGLVGDLQRIIRNEGLGSLYRGWRPTMWRDVPFSAIYWLCIEEMKANLLTRLDHSPSRSEQTGISFISGATAGLIAAACTTPFDVVKTRHQVANMQLAETIVDSSCLHDGASAYRAPTTTQGTFSALREIAKKEGIAALWTGNQARMLKVAPACAIMISTYEFGKLILTKDHSGPME
jgi:solute carrier family 25 protein 39/40